MSYSDNENNEYLENRTRKEKDKYLLETVKLLNEGCSNAVKYVDSKKANDDGAHFYTWDIDDIDYDFVECRDYCLIIDAWDVCPTDYVLCSACDKILRERIALPFTKSKSEVIYEMILLQEKMKNVLERLAMLEANASTNKSNEIS